MTRVVENIAPQYGEAVQWKQVVTKNLNGAMRYRDLSKMLGRPAPVPSIFIDGRLVFEMTPSSEDFKDCIDCLVQFS